MPADQGARRSASSPSVRTWRVTTAIRVFALALASGQLMANSSLGQTVPSLFALLLVALVSSILEIGVLDRRTPWIPFVEGIIAATLLSNAQAVDALFLYLAVPPVVAGVRHGWVTAVNTSLAAAVAFGAADSAYVGRGLDAGHLAEATSWAAIGLGAGLLASWQTRAMRHLEASQAPYAAAHDLLTQLHTLTREIGVALDSPAIAQELASSVRARAKAASAAVFLGTDADALRSYAQVGDGLDLSEVARRCIRWQEPTVMGVLVGLPLRAGDNAFGALALERGQAWSKQEVKQLQVQVDQHAVRLETALLFDDVRLLATSEERNRLAREMHDGVAQEIAALGYLIDEISSVTREPETLVAAAALRGEVSRVVGELRYSIFDLRHDVMDQRLSSALAECVRRISAGSDLRVHLTFDEQGPPLPRRTEVEVLRVAQEAINNVRKHARAINMWVTLITDGSEVQMRIEDDGAGRVGPKDGHYGLHIMRERADKINADLTVGPREDGGTVVTLISRSLSHVGERQAHGHHSSAR